MVWAIAARSRVNSSVGYINNWVQPTPVQLNQESKQEKPKVLLFLPYGFRVRIDERQANRTN